MAAQVDAGEIKATAAYEISKLQIADEQRELAQKVLSEGLDHRATVAEVRNRQSQRSARSSGRRRLPAEQRHRGSRGVRVTIQVTGKHTVDDVIADLREIADRLASNERTEAA